jgi:hypothetical protein
MPSQAPRPALSLPAITSQAFRLPWDRRADFVRALALPALAIAALRVGLWLAGDMGGALRWTAWIAHAAVWVLFAVACHRLVLLDLRGDSVPRVPGWGRGETIFAVVMALICATVMIVMTGALVVVGAVVVNVISQQAFELLNFLSPVVGTYIFARMAPALPAAAIGARVNLPEMWRRTRGNGWRLAFVVGVLPWALAYVSKLATGDDPGIAIGIVTTALSVALMAVEITALSIAYRMLTAES